MMVGSFDEPELIMLFSRGRIETITVGHRVVGRASLHPGWRWSRSIAAAPRGEPAAAIGVVLRGRVALRSAEGAEVELGAGEFFQVVLTEAHDAWVVGHESCEVLYFSGIECLIDRLRGVEL